MSRLSKFIFLSLAILAGLWTELAWAQEELPPAPDTPPQPVSSSLLDGVLSMSNESLIMLVAGVVLSLVFSIIEKQSWDADFKALLFFLACLVFGVIYSLSVDDGANAGDIGRRVLVTLAAGTIFYIVFKKPVQTLEARSDSWLNRGETTT